MSKTARIGSFLIVAAMVLLTVPSAAAKETADPPAAPIPIQILTGKKVFISNGESTATIPDVPDLQYNAFYAAMKSWGKHELVSAPADADLVFEIRFVTFIEGPGKVIYQLHLLVLDPKTHVVLWAFTEHVKGALSWGGLRNNFDEAMTKLVDDLKEITTPAAAATGAPGPNK